MTQHSYAPLLIDLAGHGYDETISLTYDDGTIQTDLMTNLLVYRSLCFIEGEKILNFNFGRNQFVPHTIKTIQNHLIFVPKLIDPIVYRDECGLDMLDWAEYVNSNSPAFFLIPLPAGLHLQQILGLLAEEITVSSHVDHDDIYLLWFLSSPFTFRQGGGDLTEKYVSHLQKSILAEDPEVGLTVTKILELLANNKLRVDLTSYISEFKTGQFVTAYGLLSDSSLFEWKALYVDNDEIYLFLKTIGIRIIVSTNT